MTYSKNIFSALLSLFLIGNCVAFVTPSVAFSPSQVGGRYPTLLSETAAGNGDAAKVVLVTGSSRGLGKAIALDIGKAGQKVVINYVSDGSKDAAEQTVKEIEEAGGQALAIQADSKLDV